MSLFPLHRLGCTITYQLPQNGETSADLPQGQLMVIRDVAHDAQYSSVIPYMSVSNLSQMKAMIHNVHGVDLHIS